MPLLRLLRKILRRLAPYRAMFLLAVLQVVVIGLLELAKPWPLKLIVDDVLAGRPAEWGPLAGLGPRTLLAVACGALVAVYALLGALSVTSNYASISIGQRMVNDFRSELYQHLQRRRGLPQPPAGGRLLYRLPRTLRHPDVTMNGFLPTPHSVVLLAA